MLDQAVKGRKLLWTNTYFAGGEWKNKTRTLRLEKITSFNDKGIQTYEFVEEDAITSTLITLQTFKIVARISSKGDHEKTKYEAKFEGVDGNGSLLHSGEIDGSTGSSFYTSTTDPKLTDDYNNTDSSSFKWADLG